MKLARSLFAVVLAAACANEPPVKHEPLPDWSGPPLQITSRGDRGLELEMTAPTAGHSLEVRTVEQGPNGAAVHLLHRTPGDAFVAQVLTKLPVRIDAERLARARRVSVWIATAAGPSGAPADERLAFVVARP